MNDLDFVVHNFNYLGTTPTTTLLGVGQNVIYAATSLRGWTSVGENSFRNTSFSSERSFQYAASTVNISLKYRPRLLKEWGELIGPDDDVYDLDDLDEFESTDFSSLFLVNSPLDESNRIRKLSTLDREEPPLKRRKLDIYPLHDLIPQPHIHPSSLESSTTPLDVPRYISKKLVPIPPHTLPFSASQFARTAWLIPIRGTFPWDASTSAVILDASFSMPISPNPNTGDPIMWTRESIASFWSYLLHLRDSHSVGTIGLSFHASNSSSPMSNSQSMSRNYTSLMSRLGNQVTLEPNITSDQGSTITSPLASHAVLSNVDHIKVYHEATNAMRVRSALFAWLYPPLSPEKKDVNRSLRVRVLSGARLVLIDERSQGVLIA